MITAIAFDYGGVISLPMRQEDMEDLAALAGIDAALMERIYWDNRPSYDQGLVDGEEYFRNGLAAVGVFLDDALIGALVDRDVESWSRVNPGTEQLLGDLKAAGMKIGVLSNMVRGFLDRKKNALPVFSIPDAVIFSCEVGAVKPEERIYRMLLEQLGCRAEELVFFDDVELNVEAARALGIEGLVWKDVNHAREELKSLGIQIGRRREAPY
ncbi:MAG: HAD family phosphatase [Treponema sp.]|nr:HAD family phosphatase [Treponema sp.]